MDVCADAKTAHQKSDMQAGGTVMWTDMCGWGKGGGGQSSVIHLIPSPAALPTHWISEWALSIHCREAGRERDCEHV